MASIATSQCPPWKINVTKVIVEIDDWRSDTYTVHMDFPPDFDMCLVDDISNCYDGHVYTLSVSPESPIGDRLLALYVCTARKVQADFIVSDFGIEASEFVINLPDGFHQGLLSKLIIKEVTSVLICSDYKYLTDLRVDYGESGTIHSSDEEVAIRFY